MPKTSLDTSLSLAKLPFLSRLSHPFPPFFFFYFFKLFFIFLSSNPCTKTQRKHKFYSRGVWE
ncbi:hypothetical protein Hanom_Chr12g01095631 [Helianthus anomalus]